MPLVSSFDELNKQLMKLMYIGQSCNFTYGVDVEFTNCPDSTQVINTIQIAINSNVDDVLIIFFPMNDNYISPLKNELRSRSNALTSFLTSRRHVKVGVNITDDVVKLEREFGIKVLNYVDAQSLAISLNITQRSMDELGNMFIPNYIPKTKPGGGYMILDEKKILYAATDAVYSLLIYYHIIGARKSEIAKSNRCKTDLPIDDDVITFATEYFRRINKVRVTGFSNHMQSCYSTWCKLLSRDEVVKKSHELLEELKARDIIIYKLGFYSIKHRHG